jgi:hypothetical protein
LILGGEARVDNNEVICLVFNPLVTRKGAKQLEAFRRQQAGPPREAAGDCAKLYDLI